MGNRLRLDRVLRITADRAWCFRGGVALLLRFEHTRLVVRSHRIRAWCFPIEKTRHYCCRDSLTPRLRAPLLTRCRIVTLTLSVTSRSLGGRSSELSALEASARPPLKLWRISMRSIGSRRRTHGFLPRSLYVSFRMQGGL